MAEPRAPSVQLQHLIHMCTPARSRTAGCYSRPPPAGSGNFHAAQLTVAVAHPPSARACRCDALAPSPIGSIATPHTHVHMHVHARARGGTAGCYSRPPPGGLRKLPRRAAQGRGDASAGRPSVPLRCLSPSPVGSMETPHTHVHARARPRGGML